MCRPVSELVLGNISNLFCLSVPAFKLFIVNVCCLLVNALNGFFKILTFFSKCSFFKILIFFPQNYDFFSEIWLLKKTDFFAELNFFFLKIVTLISDSFSSEIRHQFWLKTQNLFYLYFSVALFLLCIFQSFSPRMKNIFIYFFCSFQDFDLQGSHRCTSDWMSISSYRSLDGLRVCGSSLPPPYISSQDHVWIHFHSDDGLAGKGFRLSYITGEDGTLSSWSDLRAAVIWRDALPVSIILWSLRSGVSSCLLRNGCSESSDVILD